MKNKPIPLKLLAILHILMPAFSLIYNAWIMDMGPIKYAQLHWQTHSLLELVEFYAFTPVAGAMLLTFSSWGYVVFFAITLWTMTANTLVWMSDYTSQPWVLLTANFSSLLSALYMAAPSVRKLYFNSNIQWWKTPRRYAVNINEVVLNNDVRTDVSILNISKGGALVHTEWQPSLGENLSMSFNLGDFDFSTDAKVVHAKDGYFGVKFLTNTDILEDAIMFTDLEPLYKEPTFTDQMKGWVKDVSQGRGFFPEV